MQDAKKKGRRRSSIMVVEKTGEQEEILKNPQGENDADIENGPEKKAEKMDQKTAESDKDGKGERDEKKEHDADTGQKGTPDLNNMKEDAKSEENKDEIKGEYKKEIGKQEDMSEEDFHTAEEARSANSDEYRKKSEEPQQAGQNGARKVVGFDEEKNTEHEVEKDTDKSVPADVEEKNIKENLEQVKQKNELMNGTLAPGENTDEILMSGCEIEKERSLENVVYEGSGFKRRWLCSCFWVKKYFVLTRDGAIKYYRNKNKSGSLFIKASDLEVVSRMDKNNETHKYQIVLEVGGREKVLAFDSADVRDAWVMRLSEVIRHNRENK